jgi:hypothetical protein
MIITKGSDTRVWKTFWASALAGKSAIQLLALLDWLATSDQLLSVIVE